MRKELPSPHPFLAIVAAAVASLILTHTAFPWGGGHDPLNEIAVEHLPAPIRQMLTPELQHKIVEWSHAPDDFTPWEEQTKITLHPDDLAFLHSLGMNHPYALHAPRGQAANFILLTNAFRENAPERIAYWSACLLHTFADEAAANHDPLVHFITYGFKGGYQIDLSESGVLDFVEVTRTTEDRATIDNLLKDYAPNPLGTDPDDVLVKIMLHGLEANVYLTERGARVAHTFSQDASEAEITDGRKALAELGCYGIRTGVDAILTAYQFATSGATTLTLTKTIQQTYEEQRTTFLANRPLSHDAAYHGLLDTPAHHDSPAIGVILEPSQTMNKSDLSFTSKWLTSATMRLLRDTDTPYRPLDLRTLTPAHTQDPADLPVIIICAGALRPAPARQWLQAYAEKGGHILLIGGEHADLLGPLSEALIDVSENTHLPVTSRYGQNNTTYIDNLSIRFLNEFADEKPDRTFPFLHNPDTKSGWQKPKCNYALPATTPNVRPLAQLIEGTDTIDIAGVALDQDGRPMHIFIPEYLISPYLLTEPTTPFDPSRPTFDPIATRLMKAAIKLLRSEQSPAK
ncbi:MAG: hypothetical protein CMO55_12725 [Verrucomicrobiales bacterium]|nr:hypothetical protein [Verrucomicrobiales bacterium]